MDKIAFNSSLIENMPKDSSTRHSSKKDEVFLSTIKLSFLCVLDAVCPISDCCGNTQVVNFNFPKPSRSAVVQALNRICSYSGHCAVE